MQTVITKPAEQLQFSSTTAIIGMAATNVCAVRIISARPAGAIPQSLRPLALLTSRVQPIARLRFASPVPPPSPCPHNDCAGVISSCSLFSSYPNFVIWVAFLLLLPADFFDKRWRLTRETASQTKTPRLQF